MKLLVIIIFTFLCLETEKEVFQQGLNLFSAGKYGQALEKFNHVHLTSKSSKSAYYLALTYFMMHEDSLSEKYANLALSLPPKLADNPYLDNINAMYNQYEINQRMRSSSTHLRIIMSDEPGAPVENVEQDLFGINYTNTPEGTSQMLSDFFNAGSLALPHLPESHLDTITWEFVLDPIIDSL